MKRLTFTMFIGTIAFILTATIVRSRGQQQMEPYLGANGWTLKRNIILTPTGGEPRIIGRDEAYFSADGRRRKNLFISEAGGAETCKKVDVWDPGLGAFHEDSTKKQLVYVAAYESFGGEIDINNVQQNPEYVRDEEILGYKCALMRSVLSDGTIIESYNAYNFATFPLKIVSQNKERIQVWEPTIIDVGEVPNSALNYHAEWSVDFTKYEEDIQRMQAEGSDDSRYANQVEKMRRNLEQAKQRLRKH
ncbi:MAG: hypothetical protein HOP19_05060 [Acidobacteria bacterium]|nr:hypothetical protein [Acidobacteriota bacterium]